VIRAARAALSACLVAALALSAAGCGGGRPAGVATEEGDSYVELSALTGEQNGGELRLKVHYRFPDGLPHPDAWFAFAFEINGGAAGTVTVRKQGRELEDEGDLVATSNAQFLRTRQGTFAAQARQAKVKAGPYHDVSAKLVVEF
jgi:hypothetical protein